MDPARRALAIFAHPDDVDFGAAGTVALWVEQGWDVRYVVVTSGQKGVQDAAADPVAFGRLREAEQRAAAAAVGVTDVTFLGHMDSQVVYGPELQKELSRQFRRHRPHRLLAMDPAVLPTDFFVNHPDHRHVGLATLDITVTGGTTAAIFPELLADEGLEPWRELEETWIMGPAGGETVVDISSTIDKKIAALLAHASQTGEWDVAARMKAWAAERGKPHGYAYAESFRVVAPRVLTDSS